MFYCKYHPKVGLLQENYGSVCPKCGVVGPMPNIYEGVIMRQNSASDDEGAVCKENALLSDAYGQTYIQKGQKLLNEQGQVKYRNASKLSKEDRKMISASQNMKEICDRKNLDNAVLEGALLQFQKYITSKEPPKVIRFNIYYACIYLSCKKLHVARTLGEILEDSGVEMKTVTKAINKILEVLDEQVVTSSVNEYIFRFIYHMGITDDKISKLAVEVTKKIQTLNIIQNEAPHVIAASSILWSSALRKGSLKPKDVEDSTGVTRASLKTILKTFNTNSQTILEGIEKFLI